MVNQLPPCNQGAHTYESVELSTSPSQRSIVAGFFASSFQIVSLPIAPAVNRAQLGQRNTATKFKTAVAVGLWFAYYYERKNMSSIIRSEENGIELFTVQNTGESGMSQTGLAILSGVTKQAISTLIKGLNPSSKRLSESLQAWTDKDLNLSVSTIKQGGSVQVLKQ
jgi:hypothetical protein